MKLISIFLFVVVNFLLAGMAWSAEAAFHSHADIENTVIQFVKGKIQANENIEVKIKVNSLDSRLKLSQCLKPIEAYLPQNTRINTRFSVGVRCQATKPWQLYIPVSVAKYAHIYVANSALSRGDVLQEEDLRFVKTDVNKLRSRPITDRQHLVGMIVKRSIPAGSPFSKRYLRLPSVVKKGDSVDIIASSRGLNIRMTGQAMSAGAKGQRIRVKNSSSKKTINAVVINANTVKVNL